MFPKASQHNPAHLYCQCSSRTTIQFHPSEVSVCGCCSPRSDRNHPSLVDTSCKKSKTAMATEDTEMFPVAFSNFTNSSSMPAISEYLENEVYGIYAGLVMLERTCIEAVHKRSQKREKLSDSQWQTLSELHQRLLYEHYDLFLVASHPAAGVSEREFPEKVSLPARMWWYRIHAPLELMRSRLPDSLEHMITFIHATYSMLTLFVENVPSLEATWLECLGDLARYGMVVQEKGPLNREIWCKVSRSWYMQAADKNPGVGRLQHHLAVLSRPNILQQLFYYSKSLVSVEPFRWSSFGPFYVQRDRRR